MMTDCAISSDNFLYSYLCPFFGYLSFILIYKSFSSNNNSVALIENHIFYFFCIILLLVSLHKTVSLSHKKLYPSFLVFFVLISCYFSSHQTPVIKISALSSGIFIISLLHLNYSHVIYIYINNELKLKMSM